MLTKCKNIWCKNKRVIITIYISTTKQQRLSHKGQRSRMRTTGRGRKCEIHQLIIRAVIKPAAIDSARVSPMDLQIRKLSVSDDPM